jgi:glycosyltransferase involved in cell wall biosynthesis
LQKETPQSKYLQPSEDDLKRHLLAHHALAAQLLDGRVRLPDAPAPRGRLPLVLFSQVAWDTVWQRPQEQALGLARHRPVLFVGPVQMHEIAGRLAGRWAPVRDLAGGRLRVLSPVLFNGEYRSRPVRLLNRALMGSMLRRAVGGRRVLMLTNCPMAGALLGAIRPAGVAYDLIDDFCAFEWSPPESRAMERRLLAAAGVVVAGTGQLQERYEGRVAGGVEYLPSGVRFAALTAPAPEPADLAALPRPRLLYVGTLSDRLDGALFAEAAAAVPTGSVVVIGPRHESFRPPANLPANVHFLGLRPHTDLPGYYQHCQLGLMPFADNAAARAINPIKTLEYLAVGMPVVSSPIPDVVRYYSGVVATARPGQWGAVVARELAADGPEARAPRVAMARGRDWDTLVEALEERLRRLEAAGRAR